MSEETVNTNLSNIAIFGLSGSGKDTIANHLEYNYDYFPIRIAGTIKQLVMEKYDLSFDELEVQKRTNSELRKAHHNFGDITNSITRLKQILSGKNFEIQKYKSDYQALVIIDGRGVDNELPEVVKHPNWYVILLSRTPENEYTNTQNYTDQFTIESALKKIDSLNAHDKTIIILNNRETIDLSPELEAITNKCLGYFNISGENSTKQNLLKVIDYCFNNNLI